MKLSVLNNQYSLKIALAVIVPLIWLAIVKKVSYPDFEASVDCFYHVAVADLGPGTYAAKTFPNMTMSVWRDNFCDKELMFHLLLTGIRTLKGWMMLDMGYPFYFSLFMFNILLVGAFIFACRSFRLNKLVIYGVLLVTVSPFFTFRIMMLRPHILSIALMLSGVVILDRTEKVKSLWLLFLFSFVYAWSYSNPHFFLLPTCAYALVKFPSNKKVAILLPCVVVAGIVTGYTIHPQFPNTFYIWKIQCIDVMWQSLSKAVPISLGTELRAPDFRWLFNNGLVIVMFIFSIAYMMCYFWKVNEGGIAKDTLAVAIITTILFVGMFFGIRALEYGCPFTVLFLGMILRDYREKKQSLPYMSYNNFRKIQIGLMLFILVIGAGEMQYLYVANLKVKNHPQQEFADWAKKSNIPDGTVIANLVWSDFPSLFYSAPQFRYLFGLDPMFAYFYDSEKTVKIENFRTGAIKLSPKELSKLLNAKYMFIASSFPIKEKLKKQGFQTVYEGKQGWLFVLTPDAN